MSEPISLETPVTDDLNVGDYIEDKSYHSPEIQTKNNALKGGIENMLSTLPEKEKKIVCCRFGINGETPKTLEQLGEIMGYSKERIRQLEDAALTKIRQKKELQHFRDFIEDQGTNAKIVFCDSMIKKRGVNGFRKQIRNY